MDGDCKNIGNHQAHECANKVIKEFMYNVSQDCWLSGDVIGD